METNINSELKDKCKYAFKTWNGNYLGYNYSQVVAGRDRIEWIAVLVDKWGNWRFQNTYNEKWLSVAPNREVTIESELATSNLWKVSYEAPGSIALKSCSGGLYLCAEPDGKVIADRKDKALWETFSIAHVNTQLKTEYSYAFKTWNGNFLAHESSQVVGGQEMELWYVIYFVRYDRWCFKNRKTGKWLSVAPNHEVTFESNLEDWAMWDVSSEGPNSIALKSFHGLYLCAEPDGKVVANRKDKAPWETFSIAHEEKLKKI